jgi:hypothetical protein
VRKVADCYGLQFPANTGVFLFAILSRPTLGPTNMLLNGNRKFFAEVKEDGP